MSRRLRLFCAICSVFLAPPYATAQPTPQGNWEGQIEIPGRPLEVLVHLSEQDGAWSGEISIPAQGARDVKLTAVAATAAEVSFEIPGVPGKPTFKGRLAPDGETIAGTFTQGAGAFPFSLARKAPAGAAAAEALAGFDEFVAANLEPWDTPGLAIAIVRGGELVYAKGFGYRDVKNKAPVTPDTLFAIGSCTKAFTTFVMGTLVDEGKLDWDEPVRTYLPGFTMHDDVATLGLTPADLVTHRSGLPRHDLLWYNNNDWSRKEYVQRLRYLQANAQLRERFQYNNLMYLTAGYLIETITGAAWEDAVRTRILGPLAMSRSNFSVHASQQEGDFARPYTRDNEKNVVVEVPFRDIGAVGPAGSINSSVNDMSRWLIANLRQGKFNDQQLIQPSTLKHIHSPHMAMPSSFPIDKDGFTASYAMGWFVGTPRGRLRLQHGGGIDGFTALVTLYPFEDLGVVVLANAGGSGLANVVTLHAADRLLGEPARDWNAEFLERYRQGQKAALAARTKKGEYRTPGAKPSHALADYAGEYEHPGYGLLRIEHKDKALQATYNQIATPLEHWGYDVFAGVKSVDPTFRDMKYQFELDAEGNIARLEAPFEPTVAPIVFEKRPPAQMFDPAHLERFVGVYLLGPQRVQITRKANTLYGLAPGQPAYEFVPRLGGWFGLKGLQGFRVRFEPNEAGVMTLTFVQPNGVFTATREEEDSEGAATDRG